LICEYCGENFKF